METTISPIFGLTLLEIAEIFTILSIIVSTVVASLLYKQIRHSSNVDSARFATEYIEKALETSRSVVDILNARLDDESKKFNSDKDVIVLLGRFEEMAYYVKKGVIKEEDALMMTRIVLCMMNNDKEVTRIIKTAQEAHPTAFEEIENFMKKID